MRKNLYLAIATRLRRAVTEIAHIDLWNEHIAEVTGGTAWPLPAVFVEFEPYDVHGEGLHTVHADIRLRLHIITQAVPTPEGDADSSMPAALAFLDLIDKVQAAVAALHGADFSTLQLTSSITDHRHAELMESIETYVTRCRSTVARRSAGRTTIADIALRPHQDAGRRVFTHVFSRVFT